MNLVRKLKRKARSQFICSVRDLEKSFGKVSHKLRTATGSAVLIYHGIDKTGNRNFNTRFLSRDHFESHLQAYIKHFDIVSLSDLSLGKIDRNRFSVALTFDDGYLNNIEYALPLLAKYDLPATFFVTAITSTDDPVLWTDLIDIAAYIRKDEITVRNIVYRPSRKFPWGHYAYIDDKGTDLKYLAKKSDQAFKDEMLSALRSKFSLKDHPELWPYYKQMGTEELKSLSRTKNIEIGAHGLFHNNLAEIDISDAESEMRFCKEYLESILGTKVNSFAYPDGSYSDELVEIAKKAGYEYQYIMDKNIAKRGNEPQVISRFTINPYISTYNQLLSIIEGKYY